MKKIFKAYDIRGVYPKEINKEIAYKIGKAFAKFSNEKEIVIGKDARFGSDELAKSFIKGVLEEGKNIVDIEKCSTPIFYFNLGNYKYSAGAMVTASHNPKQYNGFKLCGKNLEFYGYGNGLEKIEKIFLTNNLIKKKKTGYYTKKIFFIDYKNFILKFSENLDKKTIVIDYGNSVEALFSPRILRETNLRVININEKIDGNFSARGPNPMRKGALKDLSKKVKKENAELGIAFDGDADRVFFVDEKGKTIRPDFILAFFVEQILKNKEGKVFVYDVTCSKIIEEIINEYGGKAIISKVGRGNIRKKIIEERADFGGELSGHYFLKEHFMTENGLIVLFKLLRYIKKEGKTLSQLIKKYEKYYYIGPISFKIGNKNNLILKIKEQFNDYKIDYFDGIIVNSENWRFILRESNTEPVVRLIIEGKNKEEVKKIKNTISNLIKENDN